MSNTALLFKISNCILEYSEDFDLLYLHGGMYTHEWSMYANYAYILHSCVYMPYTHTYIHTYKIYTYIHTFCVHVYNVL